MDFSTLKEFMDSLDALKTVGHVIEVRLEGKTVFEYASGYSDLENRIKMTGEELLAIYSASKLTTITAGMQLVEKGRISLNDPLYDYIPEFRDMYVKNMDGSMKKAENPITIADLFTMTAGFNYDMKALGFQKARELTAGKMDTVETIKCVANDPLDFEPGSKWQYSICHDVLGALISVVSGKKFRDYVQDEIFEPLQMKDCYYHHTDETLKRAANKYVYMGYAEYNQDKFEGKKDNLAVMSDGCFKNVGKDVSHMLGAEYDSGGAGIIATAGEYNKLLAALANYGLGATGERILSPYSIDLIRTNRLNEEQMKNFDKPHLAGYGYGLGVRTHINPVKSGVLCNLKEFGWQSAAGALVLVDPEINLAVFYTQQLMYPNYKYYVPRIKNLVYSCL